MNGSSYLLDTNILIYALAGRADIKPYFSLAPFISIITEIELLGVKDISENQKKICETIVEYCNTLGITTEIKTRTILLRRELKIAVPDAIIAATALENNLTLVTGDKDFKRIKDLQLILIDV